MNLTSTVVQFRTIPARLILLFVLSTMTLAAWLIVNPMENWDQQIFGQLMCAFGLSETVTHAGPLSGEKTVSDFAKTVACVIVSLLAAAFGLFSSYKLRGVPRIVSWLQIGIVVILLQWLLFVSFHLDGRPLAYLLALAFGIVFGISLKKIARWHQQQQAQHYELMLRNKELEEARLQMVKQDEMERRLLAADLHDQVLNDLKMLKQRIEDYRRLPSDEAATRIVQLLDQALNEVRDVMDSLCPSILEHLGLIVAVKDCLRKGGERGGFGVRFKTNTKEDELEILSAVEKSLLYRLVQESITNICKHAEASTVLGALLVEGSRLTITIEDDGKGIKPTQLCPTQLCKDSRGLLYMRRRADLIGAAIAWKTANSGRGTLVEISLDLRD